VQKRTTIEWTWPLVVYIVDVSNIRRIILANKRYLCTTQNIGSSWQNVAAFKEPSNVLTKSLVREVVVVMEEEKNPIFNGYNNVRKERMISNKSCDYVCVGKKCPFARK